MAMKSMICCSVCCGNRVKAITCVPQRLRQGSSGLSGSAVGASHKVITLLLPALCGECCEQRCFADSVSLARAGGSGFLYSIGCGNCVL